jgi:NAD(P)-dependent dehydrogenase (short-subunit alcohol dehydrogenase family)
MQVIVTGAGGAFGQRLLRALVEAGTLVRTDGLRQPIDGILAGDSMQPAELFTDDRIDNVRGDLAQPRFLARMMGTHTDSVFHLVSHGVAQPPQEIVAAPGVVLPIAIPAPQAQTNLEHELERSFDVARMLVEACSNQQVPPRVVFFADYPGIPAGERLSGLLLEEAGRLGILRAGAVRLSYPPESDLDAAVREFLRAHDAGG